MHFKAKMKNIFGISNKDDNINFYKLGRDPENLVGSNKTWWRQKKQMSRFELSLGYISRIDTMRHSVRSDRML